jgi:3-hydroxyisobutyrate dehydrogenase-like beta-hydroxyacid dehydrogenase
VTSVAIGQGMLAALRQGTIWAQMGTISVRATQQLAASVADQRSDVLFVDALVSGTRQPAEAGQLLIPDFSLRWATKDFDLALAEAGDQTLPVAAAIDHRWHALVESGLGTGRRQCREAGFGEAAVKS